MSSFKELRSKNPDLALFLVDSPAFAPYGRVLHGYDISEITAAANEIQRPAEGSAYESSVASFEQLSIGTQIRDDLFGTLPTQIGYCHGRNRLLNAAEWHFSSEINIAVTPLVLILGMRSDLSENRINASQMKAFYVPQGTVIEVYATTLHFCPCEVAESGFGCVVALPLGTNLPLEAPVADPVLFRKNKWIIAHEQNEGLMARGVVAGISGPNYEVKY